MWHPSWSGSCMSESTASDVLKQLLVAAGTALIAAIGSLSFVALVGAAVTMGRLRGAGLPTEQGVSVQPRSVLLAVGGETLAAAIAVSVLVALVVHLVPSNRTWWFFGPPPADADTSTPPSAGSAISERNFRELAKRMLPAAVMVAVAAAVALIHSAVAGLVACAVPWLVFRLRTHRGARWRPWALSLALGYGGWLYYLVWAGWTIDFGAPLEVAVAIVLLTVGTGCLTVRLGGRALASRDVYRGRVMSRYEFGYLLGLAVVLMLYATLAVVAASLINPVVRPAAAVVDSSRGLCGVFVAEDAEHVYIDVPTQDPNDLDRGLHDRGEMLEFTRADVTQLAIGSSQPLPSAATRASDMLDELLHDRKLPHDHCSWRTD